MFWFRDTFEIFKWFQKRCAKSKHLEMMPQNSTRTYKDRQAMSDQRDGGRMRGEKANYVRAKESSWRFQGGKTFDPAKKGHSWKHFQYNQIDAQESEVHDEKKDGVAGGKTCNYVALPNNRMIQVAPGGPFPFLQNIVDFLWELAASLGRRICKKVTGYLNVCPNKCEIEWG